MGEPCSGNSAGECHSYKVEVIGSIPIRSTMKKYLLPLIIFVGLIIPTTAAALTYTFSWGAPGHCVLSQFSMPYTRSYVQGKAVLACYRMPASLYARVTLRRNGVWKAQWTRYNPGVFNFSYACQGHRSGLWTLETYFNMKDSRGGSTGSRNTVITRTIRCR